MERFREFQQRINKAREEQRQLEYEVCVKFVAENDIKPTHGPCGSDLGRGVHGYVIRGRLHVVYLRDEDVYNAKQEIGLKFKDEEATETWD